MNVYGVPWNWRVIVYALEFLSYFFLFVNIGLTMAYWGPKFVANSTNYKIKINVRRRAYVISF